MKPKFYVGTIGMSVWFTEDLGETWARPNSEHGMHNESRIWGLAAHPDRPDNVLAATDHGLNRWSEAGKRWQHLPSPMDGLNVWSIQHAPDDPDLLIAGVSPGGFFRSEDGGKSWERRPAAIPERCDFNVISRITQILFDPKDTSLVWASVEIDAIWRSADRGRSWTRVGKGLPTDDIHGIAVTHHGGRRRLYAATNRGLHVSLDDGESFTPVFVDTPRPYFRAITAGTGGTLCSPTATVRRDPGAGSTVATTAARPGPTCRCRTSRTARCGPRPRIPSIRRWCSPARTSARSIAAPTVPGASPS